MTEHPCEDVGPGYDPGLLIDDAPYGVIGLDCSMRVRTWNETIAALTGVAAEDALGRQIDSIFPEFGRARYRRRLEALLEHGVPVVFHGSVNRGLLRLASGAVSLPHYRVTCRRAAGDICGVVLWVENATLLQESVGYLREEIAARRRAEEELRTTADSREVLYRELQHRVKNSLSLISSLVALARSEVHDEEALDALSDIGSRIDSIGLVYEQLSGGGGYGEVDLALYLTRLVDSLSASIGWPSSVGEPELDLDSCPVSVDTAVCIGLIVNELVTNSVKYAFPDGESGAIGARLRKQNDACELTVFDDGVGTNHDENEGGREGDGSAGTTGAHGLGLGIVALLADQINAELSRLDEAGTAYRLRFAVDAVPTLADDTGEGAGAAHTDSRA